MTITTTEQPLVIKWYSYGQSWRVHVYGAPVATLMVRPQLSMDLAVRLAALCAQEISAREKIAQIQVQAPPDLAERFRAIAKKRTLHLMT